MVISPLVLADLRTRGEITYGTEVIFDRKELLVLLREALLTLVGEAKSMIPASFVSPENN